jgi:putative FmdB family regulatory protein
MPIYEYRCENGHLFEVMQGMSDDPVSACEECGAPVERVFHPVAVHFKGSGFYTTDYAKKKAPAGSGDSGDSKGGDSKSESKSEAQGDSGGSGDSKSESKSSDAKPATKSSTSSD